MKTKSLTGLNSGAFFPKGESDVHRMRGLYILIIMENKKSDQEKKAEVIKAFGELLDKHCKDRGDVYYVAYVLQRFVEFIGDLRFTYRDDLPSRTRSIKTILEGKPEYVFSLFDQMTDTVLEGIMLAGRGVEGINLVDAMRDDLDAFAELCNG